MEFRDYTYERPNYEEYKSKFNILLDNFINASTYEECDKALEEINALRGSLMTMMELSGIRYTINTNDEFYSKEKDYWDENSPLYEELDDSYNKAMVASKFREELERKYGKQLFNLLELKLKAFSKDIIEDLQIENKLTSEYVKLIASAKILFNGEVLNLPGLAKYKESTDRNIRKAAWEATSKFFEDHEGEFDSIYDRLVKVRNKIAKKLGYRNFVELGYVRMSRTDYNAEMVSGFRKQVKDYIVPVASKLYERQRERLGVNELKYYDLDMEFTSGNATPKGNKDWILSNGEKMYNELSAETKEFFNFMVERNLLDLETKEGKAGGGYCTYINDYKSPFIFSNFNGTSGDIDVLTHEAGHAFQVYNSTWITVPEIVWPTYESCEIHSMSMEFLTWPWMNNFFLEDTDKYKYAHLGSAIKFIPYGVTVDEFQHFVYENPEATPIERKNMWRQLEKKYLPHKNYEGDDFLERGGFWFKQGHIFESPFYYIDYTLAQICALQFWKKANENREEAWNDYLRLCKAGGTKSFLELVELANLKSPFKEGCVSSIIGDIESWLTNINDKKL
ncbi:M3 family oligoendopeptidase [Clostridium sp. NSJ-6]|uniref:M3 family oligoendopeptidase n=1 Tax=Clostridium hominis TaxID=2763036 RepID=A0ABR7DGY1_9CLOT|nr:M3 family oligoendopeptidase [Clostridium hominis]MBC5630108.1 M3 family oligoendopeptidase [Clostridium hominis]MDU2670685.1 M3 family oligoendopeptidase [Clostridium sp.]